MVILGEGLKHLLENYFKVTSECIVAAYVFDRDGLLMAKRSKLATDSEDESAIYGALTSQIEPTLNRIIHEYPGSFGTGSFETEDHRLIFTEAGKRAILLSVFTYDASLPQILPYTYLIVEKIANLIANPGDFDIINLSVPNLHLGYELTVSPSEVAIDSFVPQKIQDQSQEIEMRFKLIVIGDPAVGKTSLINKFVQDKFLKDYRPTLGISITNQVYHVQGFEDKLLNFMIWDLAGQKFFKRVRKNYYQASNAAFVVYDVTRRETFEQVEAWYRDLRSVITDIPVVLLGNKIDLTEDRQVSREEGQKLAQHLNCSFMETSALDGTHVRDAFSIIGIGLFFQLKPHAFHE